MSNSFFERNKRKSSLALLLLLIPRARSTVVIVLLVVMFAVFFFGAKSMGMQIPWADKLLARVELGTQTNGGPGMVQLGELAKLLQGSGAQTRSFRGLWGGRGVIASYEQRDSSVKMVKGIRLDGRGGAGNDADAMAANLPKAGRGTNGVPTPEDAQKMAGGVPLNENELLSGLTKNASAKGGSGDARADSVDMLKKALQRGSAISAGGDIQYPGLRGGSWGDQLNIGAFSHGSGSGSLSQGKGAVSVSNCSDPSGVTCGRHNLAEVRALTCAAAPSGTACTTGTSCQAGQCPGEYAYHTQDAPYSGGEAGGDILSMATEPVPVTPDAQASLQSEYASANRDENCTTVFMQGHNSQATYETQLNQQFQQCCAAVATNYSSCYSSCHQSCFLFIFCSTKCTTQCNQSVGCPGVANCVNQFMSANQAIANAQYAACPGHPGSPGQNPTQNEPWVPNCGNYGCPSQSH